MPGAKSKQDKQKQQQQQQNKSRKAKISTELILQVKKKLSSKNCNLDKYLACPFWREKRKVGKRQFDAESGAFPSGSAVKDLLAVQEMCFNPWVWKIPWRRNWQPILVFLPGKSHIQRS